MNNTHLNPSLPSEEKNLNTEALIPLPELESSGLFDMDM